jgi:hypothetical protein
MVSKATLFKTQRNEAYSIINGFSAKCAYLENKPPPPEMIIPNNNIDEEDIQAHSDMLKKHGHMMGYQASIL